MSPQGRGLQVQGVPSQERHVAQRYNELWERVSGAHGLLVFPGDTIDAQLLKHAGPQLIAVSVAGCRCVCRAGFLAVDLTGPSLFRHDP